MPIRDITVTPVVFPDPPPPNAPGEGFTGLAVDIGSGPLAVPHGRHRRRDVCARGDTGRVHRFLPLVRPERGMW